jgi:hypothetical protein
LGTEDLCQTNQPVILEIDVFPMGVVDIRGRERIVNRPLCIWTKQIMTAELDFNNSITESLKCQKKTHIR